MALAMHFPLVCFALFRDISLCQPTNIDVTPARTSGKNSNRSRLNRRRSALSARRRKPSELLALAAGSSSRAQDFIRLITAVSLTSRALRPQRKRVIPRLQHRPIQERLRPNLHRRQRKNRAIERDSKSLDILVRDTTTRHGPDECQRATMTFVSSDVFWPCDGHECPSYVAAPYACTSTGILLRASRGAHLVLSFFDACRAACGLCIDPV